MSEVTDPSSSWKASYVEEALRRLYENNAHLIRQGEELAATIALRTHVEKVLREDGFLARFPDIRVDGDYGHEGEGLKRNRDGKRIRPDVIVHVPNRPINVAVIEVKGYWSDDRSDLEKLRGYLRDQHYAFAYFVLLGQERWEFVAVEEV